MATYSFHTDDPDIIEFLETLPSGRKSQVIRDALRWYSYLSVWYTWDRLINTLERGESQQYNGMLDSFEGSYEPEEDYQSYDYDEESEEDGYDPKPDPRGFIRFG